MTPLEGRYPKVAWFWDIWQRLPEQMDPVLLSIGTFELRYYSLMYIVAFAATYVLALLRLKDEPRFQVTKIQLQDLMTFMILGLIVGARLGYVLFYNLTYFLQHPLEIFLPFTFSQEITFVGITGLSYHGGLIGVLVASTWYIRKQALDFWETADLLAPVVPLGYTFGRLGNFINGELYGRVTESPIGMYFPLSPHRELRHPSQLYEAFFEGLFLFVVLWALRRRQWPSGVMLPLYLVGYGLARFVVEFFRQPDSHLGLVFLVFSMGQLLCFVMIASGILLYVHLSQREVEPGALT